MKKERFKGLLHLLLITSCVQAMVQAETWYAASKGLDAFNCGAEHVPCRTVAFTIGKASVNDIVYIKATHASEEFEICLDNKNISVNKSLTLQGHHYTPLLSCNKNRYAFSITSTTRQNVSVTISNIMFFHVTVVKAECKAKSYGIFFVENANIYITGCKFQHVCNAVELTYNKNTTFFTSIHSSTFTQVEVVVRADNITAASIFLNAVNITGTTLDRISNGTSYAVSIGSSQTLFLHVKDCMIQQTHEGVSLEIRGGTYHVAITSTVVTENVDQGVIAVFGKNLHKSRSKFIIHDVHFKRNKGFLASAINLMTQGKSEETLVEVSHCQFYENEADSFSGSVHVDGVRVNINNSIFKDNIAGKLHGTIQGFGGAIYIESKTQVNVFHSQFANNSCTGFGGTVFSRGTFHCTNCSFVGPSDILIRPLMGDILYATAGLKLLNTTWVSTVTTSSDVPKPFIWHPGSPTREVWNISLEENFKAICPLGHNMTTSGLKGNIQHHSRISVMCNPCPTNQYSLTSGSISVIHRKNLPTKWVENIVHCYHCKYGGICNKGSIRAQANYYGYRSGENNDEVRFISCPVGYCCSGSYCTKYDSCNAKRRGTLCGKCSKGMSENVINANCISTKKCKDHWFWWIYMPVGFLYILSFMYLDKISQFVKRQLIWWDRRLKLRHDLEEYDIIDVEELRGNASFPDQTCDRKRWANSTASSQKQPVAMSDSDNEKEAPQTHTSTNTRSTKSNGSKKTNTSLKSTTTNIEIFNQTSRGSRGPDIFTDILNLSFYFYQMFILLRMRDSMVLTQVFMGLKSLYSSIFTLSIEGHNAYVVCPIPNLHAIGKMLLVKSFTLYVLCLLVVFHVCVYLVQQVCVKLKDLAIQHTLIVFSVRLKVATIQLLLIGYATLTTTSLKLVNCVPLGATSVLLIDGTIICYQWWQFMIFVFVVGWIIPFPFVMVYSLVHLKKGVIDYRSFILAWTFPMFYILWSLCIDCTWKHARISKQRLPTPESPGNEINEEKLSIREILFRLESPFKGNSNHTMRETKVYRNDSATMHEPAFWQGAMIGRRFLLIFTMTFINAPVSRLYCALFLCIVYLIHQVYYRPYVIQGANTYEIVTSAILSIFCSMNLFFAYSYVSDITPEVADEHLTVIFRFFEAAILVLVPSIVVLILLGLVLSRIATLLFHCVREWIQNLSITE